MQNNSSTQPEIELNQHNVFSILFWPRAAHLGRKDLSDRHVKSTITTDLNFTSLTGTPHVVPNVLSSVENERYLKQYWKPQKVGDH